MGLPAMVDLVLETVHEQPVAPFDLHRRAAMHLHDGIEIGGIWRRCRSSGHSPLSLGAIAMVMRRMKRALTPILPHATHIEDPLVAGLVFRDRRRQGL